MIGTTRRGAKELPSLSLLDHHFEVRNGVLYRRDPERLIIGNIVRFGGQGYSAARVIFKMVRRADPPFNVHRRGPLKTSSRILRDLHALVVKHDMTYKEVGARAGVHFNMLSLMFTGRSSPSIQNIESVGEALGYRLVWEVLTKA